ncbi:RDD family protein [Candidatus Trichorickettsia mobilis]|uniref:RDD family protein n=1 Tax=Candidatus Trichorickettsia mobilis TaxID=1346319 RepID=A0ABZ0UTD3_9RICK|nr:RDD family protein [Candidatus Trichorickettsia mobilis]WPY01041.1 RDD family protein [Candidatus Trichorickettsia mobilis]
MNQLQFEYAGIWRRSCAHIIDGFLLQITLIVIGSVFFGIDFISLYSETWRNIVEYNSDEIQITKVENFANTTHSIMAWIYYPLFNSSTMQATPGKYLLKLKLITIEGNKLTLLRAIARELAMVASAVLIMLFMLLIVAFFIDLEAILALLLVLLGATAIILAIPIIITKEKKGFHDMICNTRVIRR